MTPYQTLLHSLLLRYDAVLAQVVADALEERESVELARYLRADKEKPDMTELLKAYPVASRTPSLYWQEVHEVLSNVARAAGVDTKAKGMIHPPADYEELDAWLGVSWSDREFLQPKCNTTTMGNPRRRCVLGEGHEGPHLWEPRNDPTRTRKIRVPDLKKMVEQPPRIPPNMAPKRRRV